MLKIKRSYKRRPPFWTVAEWKNRGRITAKLIDANYLAFTKWCKKHNLSFSSGVNRLIETHPEVKSFIPESND